MIRQTLLVAVALSAVNFAPAMADETSSTTVQTSTPVSSSTTQVESSSNAAGSSKSVYKAESVPGQTKTKAYSASAGPDGAKVSKTKTNVQENLDGSVSSSKQHESHSVSDFGSAHQKSSSSTTVGPDGSSSTVKSVEKQTSGN